MHDFVEQVHYMVRILSMISYHMVDCFLKYKNKKIFIKYWVYKKDKLYMLWIFFLFPYLNEIIYFFLTEKSFICFPAGASL